MEPAICAVCHRYAVTIESPERGGWIEFGDYNKEDAERILGYCEGLKWFCPDHFPAAETLSALPSEKALEQLVAQFGTFAPPPPPEPPPAPLPWWRRLFG